MQQRLWNRFDLARSRFLDEPSPSNEAATIAAFAEFARSFCPVEADYIISLLCRNLAEMTERRDAA